MKVKRKDLDVLYVEDDLSDAEFAQAMINEIGCGQLKLRVVTDGEAAAQSLGIEEVPSQSCEVRTPDLILLDLNIPRIHGKELLRRIKATDRLDQIPVVILSTSDHQVDIDETYKLGAAGYFSKPSGYEEYKGIFHAICEYWAKTALFPTTPGRS